MHRLVVLTICVAVASSAVTFGCGRRGTDPRRATTAPASRPTLTTEISYHRTGGIGGFDDRIVIAPDGHITVTSRTWGNSARDLAPDELERLARSLDGWTELAPRYPKPPGVSDDFEVVIGYADRTVTASDVAPDLPEAFRRVQEQIETLAGFR